MAISWVSGCSEWSSRSKLRARGHRRTIFPQSSCLVGFRMIRVAPGVWIDGNRILPSGEFGSSLVHLTTTQDKELCIIFLSHLVSLQYLCFKVRLISLGVCTMKKRKFYQVVGRSWTKILPTTFTACNHTNIQASFFGLYISFNNRPSAAKPAIYPVHAYL